MLIVALVTAGNDYSKELQFRALEKTSEEGNRAMVLRDGDSQLVSGGVGVGIVARERSRARIGSGHGQTDPHWNINITLLEEFPLPPSCCVHTTVVMSLGPSFVTKHPTSILRRVYDTK